jgi:nucleoside-diphosphate-sugar epimerase
MGGKTLKVLVTGGGGFLGQAICTQLLAQGYAVRAFNRTPSAALERLGVEQRKGDITNIDAVIAAAADVDAIIHSAGKVGAWGSLEEYYDVNVRGTDHVLAACELQRIRKLVLTSSPSVVHGGGDLEGVDESTPYPAHFSTPYAQTKALAEQRVLAANGAELATVALRPHFVWGPGDPNLLPRILARARAGRLRLIGDASKKIDTVFVENAANAHVLALQKLDIGSVIAGKAYFISQGEPISHERLINAWLLAAGLPAETRHIPLRLARVLGATLETLYRVVGARDEPPLTRFLVEQLSTSHWFNIAAARRDLGYAPQVNMIEGLLRLTEHLANERAQSTAGQG